MVEERFIDAGHVRLQSFHRGKGKNRVIFVHGFRGSGRLWGLVQEGLDPDQYETVAVSNRGAGDSDRSERESDYTIEAFADDLWAAVQVLRFENFTLVGHSMGAMTVTRYALDHPRTLNGLVLSSPGALDGRTRKAKTPAESQPIRAAGIDEAVAPQEFVKAMQADMARNSEIRLSAGRKSMAEVRLREHLAELRMPVLVTGGDKDAQVGIENILSEFLALPVETRSLHIFTGRGHLPNVGAPALWVGALDQFVASTAVETS